MSANDRWQQINQNVCQTSKIKMAEGGLSRPSNSEFWFSLTIKKGPNTLFLGFVGPYFQEGTIGDVISKELTMRGEPN